MKLTLDTALGLNIPHSVTLFEDNSLKFYEDMINYVKHTNRQWKTRHIKPWVHSSFAALMSFTTL